MRLLAQPLQVLALACLFACFFAFAGCGKSGGDASSIAPLGDKPTNSTPSLEEERPAVNAKINALSQALLNKDVEATVLLFTRKDEYRQMFQVNKEKMPLLAEALKSATLTDVGPGYTSYGVRIGELSVNLSSHTFSITIVKIKGEWFIQDL